MYEFTDGAAIWHDWELCGNTVSDLNCAHIWRQVNGTMNWSCPPGLDWFHGGLQFQVGGLSAMSVTTGAPACMPMEGERDSNNLP